MKINDLVHSKIARGPKLSCAWPWTGGVYNFGDGEIVIAYTKKPCAYQGYEDILHGEAQAQLVLRRSLDGGQTWPEELRQVVCDNQMPFDEWIQQGEQPQQVDMSGKDAMFWRSFSRDPWLTADGRLAYQPITFAMRSTDRGYH